MLATFLALTLLLLLFVFFFLISNFSWLFSGCPRFVRCRHLLQYREMIKAGESGDFSLKYYLGSKLFCSICFLIKPLFYHPARCKSWLSLFLLSDPPRLSLLSLVVAVIEIFACNEYTGPLRGTPLFTWACIYAGYRMHPRAMMMRHMMMEYHLLDLKRCWLDWDAKVTTHYVKDGLLFYRDTPVEDGAWVQADTRVLAPLKIEGGSRVLPGATMLAQEHIRRGQVWGGVPAAPVAAVVPPTLR